MSRIDTWITSQKVLVLVAIALCISNIFLVSTLAATGTLRTAQQGDIKTTQTTTIESGKVELPADQHFVIENPTDADFFYNIVVHVQNGGSLYPGNGQDPFVQLAYKYAPPVFLFFAPLTVFGYISFKIALLVISLAAVVVGTYLLLKAEIRFTDNTVPRRWIVAIAIATIGFQPMVANFKVGQTTPLIYLSLATMWWLFRSECDMVGGAAATIAVLFKPYFGAPMIIFGHRDRFKGIVVFAATLGVAGIVSAIVFNVQTVITYIEILLRFLFAEGETPAYDSFDAWSASHFRPFYWLGEFAVIPRIVAAVPVAYVWTRNFLNRERTPITLLTLVLVALLLGLQTATAIDMGILLAVLVLGGYHLYRRRSPMLIFLFVGFLLLQAHGYVLELLVGWGAANLQPIATRESLILQLLPFIQPGTYGTLLLGGICATTLREIER